MAERLVEILVTDEIATRIRRELDQHELPWCWSLSSEGKTEFKLLINSEDVESVVDPIQPIAAVDSSSRILVLPIEGRYPKRQKATDEPTSETKRSKRISREELYEDLSDYANVDSTFVTLVVLSTIVASGGLAKDSPALVIGAMVIAPLLGPNKALTLATTLGDPELGRRAMKTSLVGFAVAIVVGLLAALMWTFDDHNTEISARTHVDVGDIVVAFATGVAGALFVTKGLATSLVGVTVAAALLPPLVVTCMLVVAGDWTGAGNALLLVGTNVVCINLAGIATFLLQGVRPRTWWEGDRARRATRRAMWIWATLLAACIALVLITQT